ncbi:MAG: DUF366 family protein [Deltaproteobacteria bacterium]|nr:DUF366 family protein [Deltaproteobacteria bacterium]
MQIKFLEQEIAYDGSQLISHWIFNQWGLQGNATVAFIGPCDVKIEHMVDLIDRNEGKKIASDSMLHFIIEFFGTDLAQTILWQRLLVSLVQQEIAFRSKSPTIIRAGNDLYDGEAKLSVSIATASPISTLIHYGLNISSLNTPVKTKGLNDYKIEPIPFAKAILETFRHEIKTAHDARSKVRGVS